MRLAARGFPVPFLGGWFGFIFFNLVTLPAHNSGLGWGLPGDLLVVTDLSARIFSVGTLNCNGGKTGN